MVYEQTEIVLGNGFVYYSYSASTLLCLGELCKTTSNDPDDQRMSNRWGCNRAGCLAPLPPPQAQGAPSPQHFSVGL